MVKTIAITNQKGGVGKTTTAVNLTAILADMGQRVLVVDLDPQGNTTSGLGCEAGGKSVYEALMGRIPFRECLQQTMVKGLTLAGADIRLAGAELELVEVDRREFRLKEALAQVATGYDFIFIDCPPSLSLLTLNALTAAERVLIPLDLEGILLTMLDGRTNLGLQVVDEVKKHFKKKVFATTIPRNVRLGEAPSHGEPIHIYDPRSSGAEAYRSLAREVLARNGKK